MNNKEPLQTFNRVRKQSEHLCNTLLTEDYVVQACADVSPPKWHLAHTTWFYETFLLQRFLPDYRPIRPEYGFLFNSYYNAVGPQWSRPSRGHLSRPTVAEVMDYRHQVDRDIRQFLEGRSKKDDSAILELMDVGAHHEMQHQELLLTDVKYNFAINPLKPVFRRREPVSSAGVVPLEWIRFPGGIYPVGSDASGFCFDNELPAHKVLLQDFKLANRLTTCGEYLEFMADGGYESSQLWLSNGWDIVCRDRWRAPLYWEEIDGEWKIMTLSGLRQIDPSEPVCHVSHYEADAFAAWSGKRLATEFEWEVACQLSGADPSTGNFVDDETFHPRPLQETHPGAPRQLFGDVWEWTSSAYLPYPGYRLAPGAIGEYNGKFMSGQMVLRGGSVATPRIHIRSSYRNFFQPDKRWQFTGIRLADQG